MTAKTRETRDAQNAPNTDRIEKEIELRAPPARVWRAITTAKEFGTWFGADLDGEFVQGAIVRGNIIHPAYKHIKLEIQIERVSPERYFAYRWHPYANDPTVDYSREPTTLVEFFLEESGDGTNLRIVESGFDQIPVARRAEAFRMNDGGWSGQIKNIARHVA
jgi:uncharacterized protein YndB with AHSA1/START domain